MECKRIEPIEEDRRVVVTLVKVSVGFGKRRILSRKLHSVIQEEKVLFMLTII